MLRHADSIELELFLHRNGFPHTYYSHNARCVIVRVNLPDPVLGDDWLTNYRYGPFYSKQQAEQFIVEQKMGNYDFMMIIPT